MGRPAVKIERVRDPKTEVPKTTTAVMPID
jgi:hypothetical protein